VNANGEVLWDKNLSETTNDLVGNILKSADGSLLIAGVSDTDGRTSLLKVDTNGGGLFASAYLP
jgi:hypothetical protein